MYNRDPSLPTVQDKVLKVIMNHEGLTSKQLAKKTGKTVLAVRRTLHHLRNRYLVMQKKIKLPIAGTNLKRDTSYFYIYPGNIEKVRRIIKRKFGDKEEAGQETEGEEENVS